MVALTTVMLLASCGGGGGGGGQGATGTSSASGTSSGATSSGGGTSSTSSSSGGDSGCDITITTSTSPGYTQLEAAQPGQTVCLAAGTYHWRVWLHKTTASAGNAITIRAQDPAHRPVFDYSGWWSYGGNGIPAAPGSYSSSDAYRSAWRVDGAYYTIDGVIIENVAGGDENSAGIRYVNSSNLTIRNARFYHNDMGIQGGGSNTLVEYSEFDANGVPSTDQAHNIYILGGDNFTLRYSYSHDCRGGQDFHIRARNATLAYNWFQNAGDYEGDMMTEVSTYDAGANGTQNLLLIGNVFVQNAAPGNEGKFITMYNDVGTPKPTFNLTALWNTFVFNDTYAYGAGVIQFSTNTLAAGTVTFANNLVAGAGPTTPRSVVVATDGGSGAYTLSGSNNWLLSGFSGRTGALAGSVLGADPMFNAAGAYDYSLQSGSGARNAAATVVTPAPVSQVDAPPPNNSATLSADWAVRGAVTSIGAHQ